jgi:hypothetical protein
LDHLVQLLNMLYLQASAGMLTLPVYDQHYARPHQRDAIPYLLEQDRRQAKRRRDYKQLGLAYFHAGLIYSRWQSHLDAAHLFGRARYQWGLEYEEPYVCLSLFAQATALYNGRLPREALEMCEAAQNYLPRLEMFRRCRIKQAAQIKAFSDELTRLLVKAKAWLVEELRRLTLPPPTASAGRTATDSRSLSDATPADPPTPSYNERPIINAALKPDGANGAWTEDENLLNSRATSNGRPEGDVTTKSHRWFEALNGNVNFLSDIRPGSMVLVWLDGRDYQDRDLLVAAGTIPQAIYLKPQISQETDGSFCLGRYIGPTESGASVLFHHQQAPATVPGEAIMGSVASIVS